MNSSLDACPHRPPCPGCPRFGEGGVAPAALNTLNELARLHDLPDVSVVAGARRGFRSRSRLAVRGRVGSPKIGLFELDSHRVVHIPNCQVHHPLINKAASIVRRALVETQMTCYSDRAHLGLVRYLQVVVERSSQTAQLVLVVNSEKSGPVGACLDLIRERLGDELHSLWFNGNVSAANVILGAAFERWCGRDSVVEHFGGAAVHYPPGAFGQSNLDVAERIIEYVRTCIPAGARVMEYYAGVGAIGLSVLSGVGHLTLNEVSPQSLLGLDMGLAQLDASERAKVSVIPGEAGIAASGAPAAQVVIADPPRKGLDSELIAMLLKHPPEVFIYVSCGLDSLCRDAAQLTGGGMRLTALAAFDLLPFTEHVESVAVFSRG